MRPYLYQEKEYTMFHADKKIQGKKSSKGVRFDLFGIFILIRMPIACQAPQVDGATMCTALLETSKKAWTSPSRNCQVGPAWLPTRRDTGRCIRATPVAQGRPSASWENSPPSEEDTEDQIGMWAWLYPQLKQSPLQPSTLNLRPSTLNPRP